MNWKSRICQTAYKIADEFARDPNVRGVAIGGSVARGMMWKHSDLELCVLVDNYIESYQHFNYIDGLGVEIIQIPVPQIESFIHGAAQPDIAILDFSIQIYQCRIMHDPSGILHRFKTLYDEYLFHPDIRSKMEMRYKAEADEGLQVAGTLLSKGFVNTALGVLRLTVNTLLLAHYWHFGILPRSQNRTVYLLKQNAKAIGNDTLYDTFISIYGLDKPEKALKSVFFKAKQELFSVFAQWGSNAPEFLEKACDSNLEWGYTKSFIYIYKFCAHLVQCPQGGEDFYDTNRFKEQYPNMYDFLDFGAITSESVKTMLKRYKEASDFINK